MITTIRGMARSLASIALLAWVPPAFAQGDGGEMSAKGSFAPAALPAAAVIPAAITARNTKAPFHLGTVFPCPAGGVYVFSSQPGESRIVRVAPDGQASDFATKGILAGTAHKSGAANGESVLVAVDQVRGAGDSSGGLYEIEKGGNIVKWNLEPAPGRIGAIAPAPSGGWLLTDVLNDNIYHLAGRNAKPAPLVPNSAPGGMVALAVPPGADEILALNRAADQPFGGEPAIYRISRSGESTILARGPGGRNFGGMALGTGGALGTALYASDYAGGSVYRIGSGGGLEPFIKGLPLAASMAVDTKSGDLWIVHGQQFLLQLVAGTADKPNPGTTGASLAGFAGRWLMDNADPGSGDAANRITLGVSGGQVTGTAGSEGDKLVFTTYEQSKLKGMLKPARGGNEIPVTAVLSADGSRLILELAPPTSEFVTVTARRDGTGESDAAQPDATASAAGTSAVTGEEDAIQRVTRRKDVVEWTKQVEKANERDPYRSAAFRADEEATRFTVQAYERVKKGEEEHTATFRWFAVDKKTGRVTDMTDEIINGTNTP